MSSNGKAFVLSEVEGFQNYLDDKIPMPVAFFEYALAYHLCILFSIG